MDNRRRRLSGPARWFVGLYPAALPFGDAPPQPAEWPLQRLRIPSGEDPFTPGLLTSNLLHPLIHRLYEGLGAQPQAPLAPFSRPSSRAGMSALSRKLPEGPF